MARPMPDAAPVTMATLFCSLTPGSLHLRAGSGQRLLEKAARLAPPGTGTAYGTQGTGLKVVRQTESAHPQKAGYSSPIPDGPWHSRSDDSMVCRERGAGQRGWQRDTQGRERADRKSTRLN